eukprot:jgi/Chlat1/835/Chrsp104S01181
MAAMGAIAGVRVGGALSSGFLGGDAVRLRSAAAAAPSSAPARPLPAVAMAARWERSKLNDNGTAIREPMHVRTGDTVIVTAGKDKGKVTEVEKVLLKKGLIVCKDVNLKVKHSKPAKEGEMGQILSIAAPIHHSNVMHYSKDKQIRSRLAHKIDENGKKVRYLIKTGEVLPS